MRHDPERRALADVAVRERRSCSTRIIGYLPGFATPRIVCDVPFVGKRWVHMTQDYDRDRGISYWTKNYRTGIEDDDPEALTRRYHYYDPIYTLARRRAGVVAREDRRGPGRPARASSRLEQGIPVGA